MCIGLKKQNRTLLPQSSQMFGSLSLKNCPCPPIASRSASEPRERRHRSRQKRPPATGWAQHPPAGRAPWFSGPPGARAPSRAAELESGAGILPASRAQAGKMPAPLSAFHDLERFKNQTHSQFLEVRSDSAAGDLKRRVGGTQSATAKAKGCRERFSHPLKAKDSRIVFKTSAAAPSRKAPAATQTEAWLRAKNT